MNGLDSCLQRLFRAAAAHSDEPPVEPSFHLEACVLSAWRRARTDDPANGLLPIVRAAVLCACAIILISSAISFYSRPDTSPNELVIVDSVIRLSLMQ